MFEIGAKATENEDKYLFIRGKVDISNANECEQLLESYIASAQNVTLDMSELTFIDSTGIGSLVTAIKFAYSKGAYVEIINVPEGIDEIFEIIGIYDVLNSNKQSST